ncbi:MULTISPECIES: hypothetical protein [Nocardiaceae]|uniref:Uncharacterized protein n=1 Tax=Rhodococcoides corynebacterioides TaxID=53972 RepID=A0ABS2KV18_9NOCA|nr:MULTISPECIES: hypothetical protein [Rhodococcus]MBM7415793.1 hypothetical protein [Rhodococcus corynebacterioides]MBP1118255.1 hypothetical protein [Rhodococcus sp. PvP016]
MTSTSDDLTRALRDVPLKEMDPSLLALAIRYEARGRGLETSPCLVDEVKRTTLLGKNVPLVVIFEAAAADHGEALGLTADGTADLRGHLASIRGADGGLIPRRLRSARLPVTREGCAARGWLVRARISRRTPARHLTRPESPCSLA